MGTITAPVSITIQHNTEQFDCGNKILNEWLKKRDLKNQSRGASRTFVICEHGWVVGFYALASGSVERLTVPKTISRNMPDPIPVIILGRLAVSTELQGKSLGSALLKDALLRTISISQQVGVRALLVHAISEEAKRFYHKYGFQPSPVDSMTLFLSIKNIKAHL